MNNKTKEIFNKLQHLDEDKKYLIEYETEQSGLRVSGKGLFKSKKTYLIETREYDSYDSVYNAKKDGTLKSGNAGINEIRIAETFLYVNENTQTVKLRVPVLGVEKEIYYMRKDCDSKYKKVSKEEYYEEASKHGWKKREYVAQRFQSFNILKIKSVRKAK